MAQDNSQLDTDGYYGDDDADSEEIDLSFLDEKEEKGDEKTSETTGTSESDETGTASTGTGNKDPK